MSKRKSPSRKTHRPGRSPAGDGEGRKQEDRGEASADKSAASRIPSQAAVRETIESVVIAFVLAFLFRTFEAEAFVIPTGSMAPTLMGRHKDLACPICGHPYQVSASNEVDGNGARYGAQAEVVDCTCPICRYTTNVDHGNPEGEKYPSYKGDRILVSKFAYQFGDPKRWDVAVFKYPGGAMTNYIKRLVGLPNETIRISHGDIFVNPAAEDEFTIARKTPQKLLVMLQPVFDNDAAAKIAEYGFPPRWGTLPSAGDSSAGHWRPGDDLRVFETTGKSPRESWLRYQHRVPSQRQWREAGQGRLPADEPPPQLISDFSAYNTGRSRAAAAPDFDAFGLHWVGDLALKCELQVETDSGEAILELVEGGRRFQCRIDVATGEAALSISNLDSYHPAAVTKVRGKGKYKILFANCDDQLRLWIDGRLVGFDTPTQYGPLGNTTPTTADLSPVGIGTKGAALRVSHLVVLRDIYYIAEGHRRYSTTGPINDFERLPPAHNLMADPELWGFFGRENMNEVDFVLGPDQFLALGDNSAKSKDGRLWEQDGFEYYVSRELLIGKALFIYWPHSWNKIPWVNIPCPFFPNFKDMGFVR